jgi:hypothetical protein
MGGHWHVVGILRVLTHEVDNGRFIASVDVGSGTLTLFINEKIDNISNPVVETARQLIGKRVRADGEISPWSGDWVRRPYWLTPSSIQEATTRGMVRVRE